MTTGFSRKNARIELTAHLSPDRMKLFLDVTPLSTEVVTSAEILDLCPELPRDEVHMDVLADIARLVSAGEKVKDRRIIKGKEPDPGADGRIVLMVKKFDGKGEIDLGSGGVGAGFAVHLFDNILTGQTVARIYPPKSGVDGWDALGKRVPAKSGKPARFGFDAATLRLERAADAEYEGLVSMKEGFLAEDNGKLKINDTLLVRGNLDRHYGNIEFIGTVIIKGNVMPGLLVRGKTGVEIAGETRECQIASAEGDIKLGGFAYGGEESSIRTPGSLHATLLQAVDAEVGGYIFLTKEAIDCNLRSARAIVMPQAQLIGGECFVVEGLEAASIGNEAGKKTIIRLCSNVETTIEFARMAVDLDTHEKAIKLLELHLGPLVANSAALARLKGPHREKLEKMVGKLAELRKSRHELLGRKKRLLETATFASTARINFVKCIYSGTVIEAGDIVFEVKDNMTGPGSIELLPQEKRFVVGAHKALVIEKPQEKKKG